MTLTRALTSARRQTATRENRAAQHRAEMRLEEMLKVTGIADDYQVVDRKGDLAIEKAFANLYRCAPSEGMRDLIVRTYQQWMKDEAAEEKAVRDSVEGAVTFMAVNNPLFIDGAWTPAKSGWCGMKRDSDEVLGRRIFESEERQALNAYMAASDGGAPAAWDAYLEAVANREANESQLVTPSVPNSLHDSERVIARITKDGYYDRRYKIRHAAPEPIEPEGWAFVVQVVGGLIIFGGLFLALWFWLAVAAASQVTP